MTAERTSSTKLAVVAAPEPTDAWNRPTGRTLGGVSIPLALGLAAALSVVTVDVPLARARLHGELPGAVVTFLDRVETFGHGVGIFLVLTAVWLLDSARRRLMPRLIACAAGAGIAANGVKLLVGRRRPWAWLDQNGHSSLSQFVEWFPLGTNSGIEQSFPSSHTAAAFGLALGLAALYPRGKAYFLTIAALVGAQRVVFGSHFASDVLAGAAAAWLVVLGLFAVAPAERLFRRIERPASTEPKTYEMSRAA